MLRWPRVVHDDRRRTSTKQNTDALHNCRVVWGSVYPRHSGTPENIMEDFSVAEIVTTDSGMPTHWPANLLQRRADVYAQRRSCDVARSHHRQTYRVDRRWMITRGNAVYQYTVHLTSHLTYQGAHKRFGGYPQRQQHERERRGN